MKTRARRTLPNVNRRGRGSSRSCFGMGALGAAGAAAAVSSWTAIFHPPTGAGPTVRNRTDGAGDPEGHRHHQAAGGTDAAGVSGSRPGGFDVLGGRLGVLVAVHERRRLGPEGTRADLGRHLVGAVEGSRVGRLQGLEEPLLERGPVGRVGFAVAGEEAGAPAADALGLRDLTGV